MSGPVPLRIRPEMEVLEAVAPERLQAPVEAPGVRAVLQEAAPYDYGQAVARLQAEGRGPVRPSRLDTWLAHTVEVCRVAEVAHMPRFGVMLWADGSAPRAPIGGLFTDADKLAEAPGFARLGEGFQVTLPDDAPELAGASVFMPWGGGFNYGHMVLDALPSLLALEEAGLLDELAPIAPPLKRWQRELIALLLGRDGAVREVSAPVVRLRQAAYATSMDHYLHGPGVLLARVRERLVARAGPSPIRAERVYLSRRSHAHPMRVLLNEVELERALAARGFTIVRPERLSPAQQVALARQARVIVGPTGAGMTNALFAEPGALVIDIQPQVFASAWTPAFCELIGHRWRVYYAPAPAPDVEVPWVRRARRGFRFGYHAPLEDVLAMLDAELG